MIGTCSDYDHCCVYSFHSSIVDYDSLHTLWKNVFFLPEVKQSIENGICPITNLSRLQKLHYMELLKIRDPVQ